MKKGVEGQKKAAEVLRERESQVRLLLDATAEAIYGVDLEGNCTFVNPSCLRTLGYTSRDELIGKNMHIIMHNAKPDRTPYPKKECPACNAVHEGKNIHVGNEVFWKKSGKPFPAEYRTLPIERNGQIIGAVVAFIDKTEQIQADEAFQAILEGTVGRVGEEFFETTVMSLCKYLGCDIAIIGELFDDSRIKALAMKTGQKITHGYEYQLKGSPCEKTMDEGFCYYPENTADLFPDDKLLKEMGISGYVGIPLKNKQGQAIGILNGLSYEKLELPEKAEEIMKVFSAKTTAEIERNRAETALHLERDRIKEFLYVVGVILVVIDTNQDVIMINRKGCELLGYSEREVVGKNWFNNFIPQRLRKDLRVVFDSLIEGDIEQVEHFENPILIKSGEELTIGWHNTVIRDEKGSVFATVYSGEDITERKKIEEDRIQLEKQLMQIQKMEATDTRNGRMAHDFNNIISGIIGFTELALDDAERETRLYSNLQKILNAVERAEDLVNQFLTSRQQEEQAPYLFR